MPSGYQQTIIIPEVRYDNNFVLKRNVGTTVPSNSSGYQQTIIILMHSIHNR